MEFFVFKRKTSAAPTALSTSEELFVDRLAVNYILINIRVRKWEGERDLYIQGNENKSK